MKRSFIAASVLILVSFQVEAAMTEDNTRSNNPAYADKYADPDEKTTFGQSGSITSLPGSQNSSQYLLGGNQSSAGQTYGFSSFSSGMMSFGPSQNFSPLTRRH